MNKLQKAVDILVKKGIKREHAEDEFRCLRNHLPIVEKIINDESFANEYAESIMLVFEDEYERLSEKEILRRRHKELESEYFAVLEAIEDKTKEKIKELNNGKLSFKDLDKEKADMVIAQRKKLFRDSELGQLKDEMKKLEEKIRQL